MSLYRFAHLEHILIVSRGVENCCCVFILLSVTPHLAHIFWSHLHQDVSLLIIYSFTFLYIFIISSSHLDHIFIRMFHFWSSTFLYSSSHLQHILSTFASRCFTPNHPHSFTVLHIFITLLIMPNVSKCLKICLQKSPFFKFPQMSKRLRFCS